jgi:hypothetical protein
MAGDHCRVYAELPESPDQQRVIWQSSGQIEGHANFPFNSSTVGKPVDIRFASC